MSNITLYSTGCPQCIILKRRLDENGIEYETCSDIDKMLALGIMSVPVLQVDGKLLDFKEAIAWVQNIN